MNLRDHDQPCDHYRCRVPARQELIDALGSHEQWLCRERGREVVYGSGSPAHCWIMSGINHTPLCGLYSLVRHDAFGDGV